MITSLTDDPFILAGAALAAVAALAALGAIIVAAIRKMRRADAEAAEKRMAELARLQVETSARLERDARHAGRPAGGAAPRRERAARFGHRTTSASR